MELAIDEKELEKESNLIKKQILSIVVKDQESYSLAGSMVIEIDKMIKRVKDYWADPKEKAFQAHKVIVARENEMLMPLKDHRSKIARQISEYATAQERARQEAQRKLDAEREEKERKEREKLQARAAKAEEAGKTEKAEELREKAENVQIAPAIVQPEISKSTKTDTGTISQTKDIKITIVDPVKLLQEIIKGRIPVAVVNFNETKLKAAIKLNALNFVEGCVIEQVVNTSFRGK